jgi:CheY-like chemotaxis protein
VDNEVDESSQQKPTVLAVEDHPDTQFLLKTMLGKRFRVLVTLNGDEMEKVIAAEGERISVILMDISLSDSADGLELTRILRQRAQWARVPIIATTAHAFPEDKQRAIEAGCSGFIAKPYTRRELCAAIDAQLQGTGAAQKSAQL